MIKFFLLIILLWPNKFTWGQDNEGYESFFKNDSIRFDIFQTRKFSSKKDKNGVIFYHVVIKMPENIKKSLLNENSSFWIEKLSNVNTDWAANLLLYYIYEKDAGPLVIANTRTQWMRIKCKEIDYWKEFLKGRTN